MYILGKRLITGGLLFHFSSHPTVHPTHDKALAEATRLATANPGWEFCIFFLGCGVSVKPVVEVIKTVY